MMRDGPTRWFRRSPPAMASLSDRQGFDCFYIADSSCNACMPEAQLARRDVDDVRPQLPNQESADEVLAANHGGGRKQTRAASRCEKA